MKSFAPLLILGLLLGSAGLQAQNYHTESKRAIKKFEEARSYFQIREDDMAEQALREAISADNAFVEAYQMLAQLCYDQGRTREAVGYFGVSLEIDPVGNPEGYRILAGLTLELGEYEKSLSLLDTYFAFPSERTRNREGAERIREKCRFALEAMKHPVPFRPENLGIGINSKYNEYWPCLSVDEQTLMFTVMLPRVPERGMDPRNLHEDFFVARKSGTEWGIRNNAGPPLNTLDNEGAHSMTADGKYLYFTACNRRDGKGQCDIYLSRLVNGRWSAPVNLGSPVNSGNSEKHPTVSADGRILYFASDRPGGKGGYDLWMSVKQEGRWTAPVNLGDSINTPDMEQSPFIHPDQHSLYFSSSGWPGMGQGDLFLARRKGDGTWSAPRNLGYPINTFSNEIGLSVNARGDRAYFASDRGSGTDTDIYTFELPPAVKPVLVSYMTGRTYDARSMKGVVSVIQLIDLATEETVMEMESAEGEGDFLFPLPTDRDYALNVSAGGYLFYSENFTFSGQHGQNDPLRRDIPLDRVEVGRAVVLNNIFFEVDSHELLPTSVAELHKILAFLQGNPGIRVEIGGHTDNTGSAAHNQTLSEARARAVVDFLTGKGIQSPRLEYKGYADRVPVADNTTEEGRAHNRRTELKIVGSAEQGDVESP
ncbi:MAG: OmpA family protein [Bacteroidales bacterium]